MELHFDEVAMTFILGAITLYALMALLRFLHEWFGADVEFFKILAIAQKLLIPRARGQFDGESLVGRSVVLLHYSMFAALFYSLGLFAFNVSHDIGAERNVIYMLIDDYLDNDFALRLRSLLSVPFACDRGIVLKRTSLFNNLNDERDIAGITLRADLTSVANLFSTTSLAPLQVAKRGAHAVGPTPGKPEDVEGLREKINELFYLAKNVVYREKEYNDELRTLEARMTFFRTMAVIALASSIVAFLRLLPSPRQRGWIRPLLLAFGIGIAVVVSLRCGWLMSLNDGVFERGKRAVASIESVGIDAQLSKSTLLAVLRYPKEIGWYAFYRAVVLGLNGLTTLLVLVIGWCGCRVLCAAMIRWGNLMEHQYADGHCFFGRVKLWIIMVLGATVFTFVYSDEAKNYNRRVFGYYHSLLYEEKRASEQDHRKPGTAATYVQASGEYVAACIQAYNCAEESLESIISGRNPSDRKWAVVMDLDETVIDNSAYQAWLIKTGCQFSPRSWGRYVLEAIDSARAVPGAVDFVSSARRQQMDVFFISNRTDEMRAATIATLRRLGIEVTEGSHLLLRKDDMSETDKSFRCAAIMDTHEIVMFCGDNLRDFDDSFAIKGAQHGVRNTISELRSKVLGDRFKWGRSCIILPNPVYGEWEKLRTGGAAALVDAPGVLGANCASEVANGAEERE